MAGRSLSQKNCREIARELTQSGVVASISGETIRRFLARHKLKPWRKAMGLSPKVARDEAFMQEVQTLADLYTRALADSERVLCLDEKTSLQPRCRLTPTRVWVVLDNVRMHTGKAVQAWLGAHPRFVWVHLPVPCSWLNQIEQWFGILQRKRSAIADFASKAALAERIKAFIAEWNAQAHAFAKVLAKCQAQTGEPTVPVST